jgi:hypothetical protein
MTLEPTKAPTNTNKKEKNGEQDKLISALEPTQRPTYGYPSSDGVDGTKSGIPTTEPASSPVTTLFADGWVRGSSPASKGFDSSYVLLGSIAQAALLMTVFLIA